MIPSDEELPNLLDAISAEAQRTGVELTLIQPVGATEEQYYTRRVYDMAVTGGYHQIGEFLTRVASLPRIITPIDLTLRRRGEQGSQLEAGFRIETYVLPQPGDSMMAAARMLRGLVPIDIALKQSSEATTVPEVAKYWEEASTELERGVLLGAALDRQPLTRAERLEVASLSDLKQVATVLESIADMRAQSAKTKHSLIVWLAFGLTGVFLAIAFGSAIYALTVMNMSMDSVMGGLMEGAI